VISESTAFSKLQPSLCLFDRRVKRIAVAKREFSVCIDAQENEGRLSHSAREVHHGSVHADCGIEIRNDCGGMTKYRLMRLIP
jgi:hypothetical protein